MLMTQRGNHPSTKQFIKAVVEAAETTRDRWRIRLTEPIIEVTVTDPPVVVDIIPDTPTTDSIIPIRILDEGEEAVLNAHPRVRDIEALDGSFALAFPFTARYQGNEHVYLDTGEINYSAYCVLCTLARCKGGNGLVSAVADELNFQPVFKYPGDVGDVEIFDKLANELDICTRVDGDAIDENALNLLSRGAGAIVMRLNPGDDGAVGDYSSDVLVIGYRKKVNDGKLEFLVAHPYADALIDGETDRLSPNFTWATAEDVVKQSICIDNPSAPTIRVYKF